MNELAKIDEFNKEIAIAETVEELSQLNVKGELMAEMAKKLDIPLQGQNTLGKTRIELSKKLREVIEYKWPHGGDRGNQYTGGKFQGEELGINKNVSSDAKIIKEEEELVKEAMKEIEDKKDVITPRKVASTVRKKKKQLKEKEKSKKGETLKLDHNFDDFKYGDFMTKLSFVKDDSVDLILTDPPYPKEYLDEFRKLGEFGNRVLKPGGFLISYSGHINLPEVLNNLSQSLNFYWVFALMHTGQKQLIMPRNILAGWKPILIYQKGFEKLNSKIEDIIIGSGREKGDHEWQQGMDELEILINHFSSPGDKICDPFAGSGTTLIKSIELKRQIIGAEIDKEKYNIAKLRIKEYFNE